MLVLAAVVGGALALVELGDPGVHVLRVVADNDMLELGAEGPRLHAALANSVLKAKADLVFCCGPQMDALYNVLPEY